MRPTITVLAVAGVLAGSVSPAGEKPADRYAQGLQQARTAVAGRDHPAALVAHERLLRLAPYHPGFHYQVARLTRQACKEK